MIGREFNRWTVVKEAEKTKCGQPAWECVCVCGNKGIIDGNSIRRGLSKSCGCLNREKLKKRKTHGMSRTPTYDVWAKMISRCNNPKDFDYQEWGGRGITVCAQWLDFPKFFSDMGTKPEKLTIDRIDNDGNYEIGNCRWATRTEQNRNQRTKKNNKTRVSGVEWSRKNHKYRVRISANNKRYHIGSFATLQEAKTARLSAEQKYWRE